MLHVTGLVVLVLGASVYGLSWNTAEDVLPWESYLEIGEIQRPLGLTLNRSSIGHRHFYIGYLCVHSFLYDEAQDAFDLAISKTPTLIEAYIGKMLGCKHALWSYTNYTCGQTAGNASGAMLLATNTSLSDLQSSLLHAVHAWYANESDTAAGETKFLSAIANISRTYSNETDLRVLWALSLLNVATQVQFQAQMEPEYMINAREKLSEVLSMEPNHPGILHYLIHAYDVMNVETAQKAREYGLSYEALALPASHAQHMSSHIWVRTGSWDLAMSSNRHAIRTSIELCATKLLNRTVAVSSTALHSTLTLFNVTQIPSFLLCDAENRAHATEWLAYARLHTGDWSGGLALLDDLFTQERLSVLNPHHYLSFAYRTQARAVVELFFWFYGDNRFLNSIEQALALNGSQSLVSIGDNTSDWYPMWSEAGVRFSECLRLSTMRNATSLVNDHLHRLSVLANRTSPLSEYVSISISLLVLQIRGVQACLNQSWQICLDGLDVAVQRESQLVPVASAPTLIFVHASEMLAMHLLLIYDKYLQQTERMMPTSYLLSGAQVWIDDFPLRALRLYQIANSSAPNRAINTLGAARSYAHLRNDTESARFYRRLQTQLALSNSTDAMFVDEIDTSFSKIEQRHNSAAAADR